MEKKYFTYILVHTIICRVVGYRFRTHLTSVPRFFWAIQCIFPSAKEIALLISFIDSLAIDIFATKVFNVYNSIRKQKVYLLNNNCPVLCFRINQIVVISLSASSFHMLLSRAAILCSITESLSCVVCTISLSSLYTYVRSYLFNHRYLQARLIPTLTYVGRVTLKKSYQFSRDSNFSFFQI